MVFDVPAVSGGSLSILNDFYHEIIENKNKYTQKKLGEIYGVSQGQICRILNKKRWHQVFKIK